MKIGTKINILLALVFIGGVFTSGAVLSDVLQQKAQNEVTSKALILMQVANSVRQYTNDYVNPLLEPRLEQVQQFIPETIPTFSARLVFEILRKNQEYKNFIYKDATLNPTNLNDKADNFEAKLVQQFRQEPDLKTLSGFRNMSGNKLFYSARPFIVEEQKCLRCHSNPDQAPKSQIETYGNKNGFGWNLNEIVASQIIYVPAEDIFNSANQSFLVVMGVLILVFSVVTVVMNFLLRKTVLQRIKKISIAAEEVSTGNMNIEFERHSSDEIGILGTSFNRMKRSLEIALDLLNQTKS
jgi:HAMP domain-containing protein